MAGTQIRVKRLWGAPGRARALEVCRENPRHASILAQALQAPSNSVFAGAPLVGIYEGGKLCAVASASSTITSVGATPRQLEHLAGYLLDKGAYVAALAGPTSQVLPVWQRFLEAGLRAVDVRHPQPFYCISEGERIAVAADPLVRPALPGEAHLVEPAAVHMFFHEVGYDPSRYGYGRRVTELIECGRTYIRTGTDPSTGRQRVEFKADVGALALGVAHIEGVWVAPDLRGRGMAAPAMAAVIEQVRASHAPEVTLYANSYNKAALATYERVGMTVREQYTTVMLA